MTRSVIPRALTATVAGVLFATTGITGVPAAVAADPDPGVAEVLDFLGASGGPDTLASWTSGLATVGRFAQPLPLVSASPGGLLGLGDMVGQTIADEFGTPTTFGDLQVDKDVTVGGGRTGHLTTSVDDAGSGKRLDVVATMDTHATGQALALTSDDPKVDLSVTDGITLDAGARFAFSVIWTGPADDHVYLVADASGPRLDVDVHGTIDTAAAKAAVGILGVELTGSTLDLRAHLVARVDDPDNNGRLAFDETSTGDGELAADGSLDGLVTVGLDPQGSLPADSSDPDSRGSVQATFALGAAASGVSGLDLPSDIASTVSVSWPDIGTGTPTVSAPDLAAVVGKFQNMSLRDLADGLAQVVTGLTAIQKAKFDADGAGSSTALTGDLDLPFMKGSVSDAVKVNQVLKDFLDQWVVQAADPGAPVPPGYDPAKVGQPRFSSLQDLLAKLQDFAGISLGTISWDEATSKLAFAMTMTRSAPSDPVPLDEQSLKASGDSATYSATGLQVDTSPWQAGQWVGMRIVAGTSAGEIASNTASSLTLKGDWIGGTPSNDTPFVIVGPQPNIGAVTFADGLQDSGGHGIVNANADQTFARVTPSFTASVTLVLDLRDPLTGADCIGFEGNTQACPFSDEDGPFQTQVDSLPLNVDRMMIRTGAPLFTADFPIDTQVDLTANAGFFKVRIQGDLSVCNSSQAADCSGSSSGHMLTVGLKPLGDTQHDIRFRELFDRLVTPDQPGAVSRASTLLTEDLGVRAHGSMTVSIPDAGDFLPSASSATFTAAWNDLTKTSGPDGPRLDTGNLGDIFSLDIDPHDPSALFAVVIKTLQTLSSQLADANPSAGGGVFDASIPGTGRSLRDLFRSDESNQGGEVSYGADTLTDASRSFDTTYAGRAVVVGTQVGVIEGVKAGDAHTLELVQPWTEKPADETAYMMRSPLDDAVDALLASPPDSIQDLVAFLNQRLGSDSVSFRYLDTGGTPNLVLDLDWHRGYTTAAPVRLDLDAKLSGRTFAGAKASGNASVAVSGKVAVGLVVPLLPGDGPTGASSLKVLQDSSINVAAHATFDGSVQGVIGPLSLALGKPGGAPSTQATARADISLDLDDSSASPDTPVSFADYLSGIGVTFNATNAPVDCGEGLTTPLMVCGQLPIYVSAPGSANTWTETGTIALRLPDSQTPDDLTTLTGTLPSPDDTTPRLEIPSDLGDQILNAVLDFSNLGSGLEDYLVIIEQAFRVAAFDGRLPLIGDDLQQGADFIGDLRSTLQNSIWSQLPGGGRPLDASEVVDFINGNLESALDGAGMTAADLAIGLECTATLSQVGQPTVTPTTEAPGSATWAYKIVAYQGDGSDASGDTVPSPAGTTTSGADTLDENNVNTVQWAPVDGADGYKILRKGPGDSDYVLLASQQGTTYTDSNQDGGSTSSYTPVGSEPQLVACPADSVDGVTLSFTVQQGQVSPSAGCETVSGVAPCIGQDASGNPVKKIPLDIGIPGLALKAGPGDDPASKGITYGLGYQLHFTVGLSKSRGFYVKTHDAWGPNGKAEPELQVGLGFDLPSSMLAELAFLKIHIDKATGDGHDPSAKLFAGAFQVDLRSTPSEESCWTGSEPACAGDDSAVLTLADLGDASAADLFGISLKGGFHIDWNVVADADAALPGVRANFQLDWAFDNAAPEDFGAPSIAFLDVGINAGSFFAGLLGPIVKEIKRVTGPVQPVVDTLYAPIPVLSDLSRLAGGGDVTLITLATTFNTLTDGPSLEFVDTIKAILEFIDRLPACTGGEDCYVPIGDFQVLGEKALTTSNSPTTGGGLVDPAHSNATSPDQVKSDLNAKNSASTEPVFATGSGLAPAEGDAEKSGFTFPILDHPESVFTLLMGGDVTLVEFDSGPLTLGFSWRQSFGPVYAPPPVMVTLSGSASVTLHVVAGLDTYGIRHAVEAAQSGTAVNPVKMLDGLFFKTVDDQGKPIPVVQLDGEIAAGAAVTALIITVGIEGGLHLTIGFYWNDPNGDGKFRVSEFAHAAINNPLCLFTTSGRLSLFLRVYVTIGVSIFSTTFSFTLANVTLLDFTAQPDCEPPPPRLGGTVGNTLVVYAGKFGGDTTRGSPWGNTGADYDGDVVKVIALHFAQRPGDPKGTDPGFDGFAVEMLGERREYLDSSLQRVVVDGSGYTKPMQVTFIGDGKKEGEQPAGGEAGAADLSAFDKDAVVIGGEKDDVIQTGTGKSFVDGRGGDDQIVTADTGGPSSWAWVAGGADDDTITTGNGNDHVAGDGSLGTAVRPSQTVTENAADGGGSGHVDGIVDWNGIADPTSSDTGTGADTITVGLGQNTAMGNGGNDTISVASDAADGSKKAGHNDLVGGTGGDNIVGGSGSDTIWTSTRPTTAMGVDDPGEPDSVVGSVPGNIVETGAGNDTVYGSRITDLVTSHSSSGQHATLIGGAGNDVLVGGYGQDKVFGGPGKDYVIAEPSEVGPPNGADIIDGVGFGPKRPVTRLPLPAGTSPQTKTLVGGLGNDHIIGGDGASVIFGDTLRDGATVGAAADETCRPGDPVVSDPVPEGTSASADGDGNDLILGGAGVDTVSAGGGNDRAELFGGVDKACGQEGADVLFGGGDRDLLWGGSGADRAYGGNGIDYVFGNSGDDHLYGQADTDVIEGNDGSDWASGGPGDDLVYGGTRHAGRADRDSADHGDDLYGDSGADRLIGDNGTVDDPMSSADAPAVPVDLAGTTASAGRGDRIHGGEGDDTAYGGLGDDHVYGNAGDDHLEGNNASDTVHGNAGEDSIVGGSFEEAAAGVGRPDAGDRLYGDEGPDLITGDNAVLTLVGDDSATTPVTRERGFALGHAVTLLDLGDAPTAGTSGDDLISGGDGPDVLYGQGGSDRARGDVGDDYVEGGQGSDWVEGNLGDDDLVGGSSTPESGTGDATQGQPDGADDIHGGPGDDVITGDNGRVLRPAAGQTPTRATIRLGSEAGTAATPRTVQWWDRNTGTGYVVPPSAIRFGADHLAGGDGVDVIWGQDGADAISGGPGDDYVEGNGGEDVIRGDRSLAIASDHGPDVVPLVNADWPGSPSSPATLDGTGVVDGQDDLIGGTATPAYRDDHDTIEGNGGDDVILGDNGSLVRTLEGAPGSLTERVYTARYPDGAVPADATVARTHDPALPGPSTRFCTTDQQTCEPPGTWGGDDLYGDDGNDGIWGQDGNDTMFGGFGDDDMYGELGDDTMSGGHGEDAMVGDRGGIVDEYLSEGDDPAQFTIELTHPPAEGFTGFRRGLYDRRVDLLHDVDGNSFVGDGTAPPMTHPGLTEGGRDAIRGGPDADNIHAGYGDDLANGDSGGDQVFGDDGEDVLWGGKGCDPVLDATAPDCLTNGVFDPTARGTNDRMIDHVFGGVGESDPAKQDVLGADILDFNPRGSYDPGAGCTTEDWPSEVGGTSVDPCVWFEMTGKDDADATNDNHHQGTDWIYGGWDRDVLQGDVTANGPNPGDRLIDWNGAYNLYTHCNASYGGFNDIRLLAPDLADFLTKVAWASGAGQAADDVTTVGTSAYRELAFTYTKDQKEHGTGKAFPTTPGHFDDASCEP